MIKNYVDSIKRVLSDIEREADLLDDRNLYSLMRKNSELHDEIKRKNDKIAELQYRIAELGINYGRGMAQKE